MINAALLAAVIAVPSRAAPAASPRTFESSALDLGLRLGQAQAASLNILDAALAARLKGLSRSAQDFHIEIARLRAEMNYLPGRLAENPNRPRDPDLSDDIRRMAQDFKRIASDLQADLAEARTISAAIVGKDPDLKDPAAGFANTAQALDGAMHWLETDVRTIGWHLRSAGFPFESLELERAVWDISAGIKSLKAEADQILAKTR